VLYEEGDKIETISVGQDSHSWRAYFTSKGCFIEAPEEALSSSKESLVELLDHAEEKGSTEAHLVLSKNRPDLRATMQSMMFLGFNLVAPTGPSDTVVLRYEL